MMCREVTPSLQCPYLPFRRLPANAYGDNQYVGRNDGSTDGPQDARTYRSFVLKRRRLWRLPNALTTAVGSLSWSLRLCCMPPRSHHGVRRHERSSERRHEAHIVGEKAGGPRGISPLTQDERDEYTNLILLCRTHHGIIDDKVLRVDYPVERLHAIKSSHETWIREHLAAANVDPVAQAGDLVYATLIDEAVDKLCLAKWRNWTRDPLHSTPQWYSTTLDNVIAFRDRIQGLFSSVIDPNLRLPFSDSQRRLPARLSRLWIKLNTSERTSFAVISFIAAKRT